MSFFRGRKPTDDRPNLDAELEAHLRMSASDRESRGADRKSAAEAARRDLGNIPLIQQTARDHRPIAAFFGNLLQDIRFALRMLGKNPGFTTIAVLTLTLGIGANTAIFSVVNAVILNPLPFKNSSRLLDVAEHSSMFDFQHMYMSIPDINDMRASTTTLSEVSPYTYSAKEIVVDGKPDQLDGVEVTETFFPILGLQPLLGRAFTAADMDPGARVVLLSHKIWREGFASDRSVLGKTMLLDGQQHTIIGVMPAIPQMGFATDAALWTPFHPAADIAAQRKMRIAVAVASLKPGATFEQAQRELEQISARLAAAYPDSNKIWDMHATPLKTSLVGDTSTPLLILFGAVGFVLLIACANVSNLFLSRGWARRREFAIRSAIGATRGALLRQQLVESALIALIGGVCALAVAAWIMQGLRALLPPDTPRLQSISVDSNVALFTLAAALLAAFIAGLAPALLSVRDDVNATIKETGASASRTHNFLRQTLVVAEVALALTLVIGASLAVQSFSRMLHVDAGFRTDHLVTMRIEFPSFRFEKPEQGVHFTDQVLESTRALSGVEAASAGLVFPLGDFVAETNFTTDTSADPKSPQKMVRNNRVEPDFFRTFGIPLLAGRDFTRSDTATNAQVFIVNQAFARKAFGTLDVLGRRISTGQEEGKFVWGTIIGLVGDVRDLEPGADRKPELYAPFSQTKQLDGIFLAFRTTPNPAAVIGAIQNRIWELDRNRPITSIKTIDQRIAENTAAPRSQSMLLAIFGALGLLLAVIGVYGVMSYLVTQQTREIGIRIALGADPQKILRMVIARSVKLSLVGVAIGLVASFALTRFLSSLLYNTSPTDPLTFATVGVALIAVAIAAAATPARRAMHIDPIRALRHD
jgi:putative ABC transport system permease protein